MAERVDPRGALDLGTDASPTERRTSHLKAAKPDYGVGDSRLEEAMQTDVGSIGPIVAAASLRARSTAGSWAEAYGAASVGQFTVAFVDWVRRQCELEGIAHVEFLARDGLLPFEVARSLPADHFGSISLSYLHANRKAWGLAAAAVVGVPAWREIGLQDRLAFLLHAADQLPWSTVLKRCGLTETDIPEAHRLSKVSGAATLSAADVDAWADLLRSGELDATIAHVASEKAALVGDFIRQRRLPPGRIALVDVGWRGQQAWLISSLIAEVTGVEPLNLHFGADGPEKSIDERIDVRRFALDDSLEPHPIHAPVLCLETFLAPGTPRLSEYRRADDGTVYEVFDSTGTDANHPTRFALVEGAQAVARAMPSRSEMTGLGPARSGVRALLNELWTHPTAPEVRVIETLRFELDDSGTILVPIAAPYSSFELIRRRGGRRLWSEGSAAISAPPVRLAVKHLMRRKKR